MLSLSHISRLILFLTLLPGISWAQGTTSTGTSQITLIIPERVTEISFITSDNTPHLKLQTNFEGQVEVRSINGKKTIFSIEQFLVLQEKKSLLKQNDVVIISPVI